MSELTPVDGTQCYNYKLYALNLMTNTPKVIQTSDNIEKEPHKSYNTLIVTFQYYLLLFLIPFPSEIDK